jgi:hypothetical protein
VEVDGALGDDFDLEGVACAELGFIGDGFGDAYSEAVAPLLNLSSHGSLPE